jgi:hypothetical protein
VLGTQELADLKATGEGLREQVLGNVAAVIVHRQNVPESAELIACDGRHPRGKGHDRANRRLAFARSAPVEDHADAATSTHCIRARSRHSGQPMPQKQPSIETCRSWILDRRKTARASKIARESQADPVSPIFVGTAHSREHAGKPAKTLGLFEGRSRVFQAVPGTRDRKRTAEYAGAVPRCHHASLNTAAMMVLPISTAHGTDSFRMLRWLHL